MGRRNNYDEVVFTGIVVVIVCSLIGGMLLMDIGTDIILLDVLDEVCEELFPNSEYQENNDGKFTCIEKRIEVTEPEDNRTIIFVMN